MHQRRGVIYHVPLQRRVHCASYLFLGDYGTFNQFLPDNNKNLCFAVFMVKSIIGNKQKRVYKV